MYLHYVLVKFKQNRLVQTTQMLSFDAVLEDVSVAEPIIVAKLVNLKLPIFSVPKITVVRHV